MLNMHIWILNQENIIIKNSTDCNSYNLHHNNIAIIDFGLL